MPIHLLSAVNPTVYVINQLQKMFAIIYWSNLGNGRAKHLASWDNLCLPNYEGGLGFRSLHDVSKAFFSKHWWNYRAKNTLWSTFMRNKYCKKINEVVVPWRQGSRVWKKMLQMRDEVEHQMWWQLKSGNSYFWFDNWTGLGAHYHASVENGAWNEGHLTELLPEELADHILDSITPPSDYLMMDKPWWKLEIKGQFTVKGDNGGASYGFCIRDSIGDLIYAQANIVEEATNNIAEAHAILEAVRYIVQMQYPPCLIETGSLLMKKVLDDVWESPWSIANQVDEIKGLLAKGVFQIVHVLREGNKLADHLENLTLDQQHIIQVHSFWELKLEGRKILNNDKLQIPYIRVRTAKPSTLEEDWLYVLAKSMR
ncbi:uncharacterized protein [Nicotiana tomentosiformis]|uniref:uncharacterized protein n=1 Tax=Nicotiana tomentosiformis TaxID=4098 RepID=UPI00388C93C5